MNYLEFRQTFLAEIAQAFVKRGGSIGRNRAKINNFDSIHHRVPGGERTAKRRRKNRDLMTAARKTLGHGSHFYGGTTALKEWIVGLRDEQNLHCEFTRVASWKSAPTILGGET